MKQLASSRALNFGILLTGSVLQAWHHEGFVIIPMPSNWMARLLVFAFLGFMDGMRHRRV
jgi:hypothetical protein